MLRKVLGLAVVLLVFYIVSRILIGYILYQQTPLWRHQLAGVTEQEIHQDSELSVEFQRDNNRIAYELMLADNWTKKEVDELIAFMTIPEIEDDQVGGDPEKFDIGLLELWLRRSVSLSTISERFRVGAPIDEDQRQRLIDELIAGLYQTSSFRLYSESAAKVAQSGLADTPGPIRDRLLYIYNNPQEDFGDLGLSVAENIKRQLKGRGVFEAPAQVPAGGDG